MDVAVWHAIISSRRAAHITVHHRVLDIIIPRRELVITIILHVGLTTIRVDPFVLVEGANEVVDKSLEVAGKRTATYDHQTCSKKKKVLTISERAS